jgi:hypothetical protein
VGRLLPLIIALLGLLIVVIVREQASRSRRDDVYRPRGGFRGPFGAGGRPAAPESGTNWVVARADLEGLRDAYSSAAVDPSASLTRCGGCQAVYHASSLAALRAENGGRCVLCGSRDIRPVQVV